MSLKLATLTLRREGRFHQLVSGPHHCGAPTALVPHPTVFEGRAIPIRFQLTVACGPVLDQRGFLFDQAMVEKWFERKGESPSSLSCEALTISLANQLMDKINRGATHCDLRGLTLQLSPAPHQASLSAHYIRE